MNESIILDNGKEYLIMDTKEIDGTFYTFFVNIDDDTDMCFRKTIISDNEEYYVGLDNEEELKKALLAFAEIK